MKDAFTLMPTQPEHDIVQLDPAEAEIWEEYRTADLRTRREQVIYAAKWAGVFTVIMGGVVGLEVIGIISPYAS